MISIRGRQTHPSITIEIDATVMNIIRVLMRIQAAGFKPDMAFFFIHLTDSTHHPLSLRELPLELPCLGIQEIEVVPAISLRHPENFPSFLHEIVRVFVGVINEGRTLLVDQGGHRAIGHGNGHHTQDLMPPLIVEEGESLTGAVPSHAGD